MELATFLFQVNWVAVQAVGTVVLVLTSAGAIAYAALQLRHEREYRAVVNLERQLAVFLSEGFLAARRKLAEDRMDGEKLRVLDKENPPISAFEVLDFYEHLGLLIKKGHLELYDVWHTFYEWAQPVYADLKAIIEERDGAYAIHYADFRKLMRKMDTIQQAKMKTQAAGHWTMWTPERIVEHYKYELQASGKPRRRR